MLVVAPAAIWRHLYSGYFVGRNGHSTRGGCAGEQCCAAGRCQQYEARKRRRQGPRARHLGRPLLSVARASVLGENVRRRGIRSAHLFRVIAYYIGLSVQPMAHVTSYFCIIG